MLGMSDRNNSNQLTLYAADSPVKISQSQQISRPAWTVNKADCGGKCFESFGSYDRATHSLKTSQGLLHSDSTECLQILPQSGLMRSGKLYTHPISVVRQRGKDFLWLPTITATDWQKKRSSLKVALRILNQSKSQRSTQYILTVLGVSIRAYPAIYCWMMGFSRNFLTAPLINFLKNSPKAREMRLSPKSPNLSADKF